ncbi:WG repeat-containing protein [Apibacter sp. HY039]|uniref:WG repeat-containing protein n=1 Tax=Apibacter sp. HY039 TaxID=2501476 RepID=UPI0013E40E1D|nr:WG repeat-containing protein [Apibacter sp. HY039]
MIDNTGKAITPCIYDEISYLSNGLALVEKEEKYRLIYTYGNVITPLFCDGITYFSKEIVSE